MKQIGLPTTLLVMSVVPKISCMCWSSSSFCMQLNLPGLSSQESHTFKLLRISTYPGDCVACISSVFFCMLVNY